jgi:hypothetical protein
MTRTFPPPLMVIPRVVGPSMVTHFHASSVGSTVIVSPSSDASKRMVSPPVA